MRKKRNKVNWKRNTLFIQKKVLVPFSNFLRWKKKKTIQYSHLLSKGQVRIILNIPVSLPESRID